MPPQITKLKFMSTDSPASQVRWVDLTWAKMPLGRCGVLQDNF
jgi:hypothetical protein